MSMFFPYLLLFFPSVFRDSGLYSIEHKVIIDEKDDEGQKERRYVPKMRVYLVQYL